MREEWNKGYEKGRDDYCCNGDCNQGRDCPLRKLKVEETETIRYQQEEIMRLNERIHALESQIFNGSVK
jgi:hypothetical protein